MTRKERTDFSGGNFATEMVAAVRYRLEAPVQVESRLKRRNITHPKRGSHATRRFLRSKRLGTKVKKILILARTMRWNVRASQVGDRDTMERLRLGVIKRSITRRQEV